MNIFNNIGLGNKVTANTGVAITENGKRIAQQYTTRGPNFAILAELDEKSPQTISELTQRLNMDTNEIKKRVDILENQRLVQYTGGRE